MLVSQSNSGIEKNVEQSGIFWLFCAAVITVSCTFLGAGNALAQSVTIAEGETRTATVISDTVTNSGSITTSGDNAYGIFSQGVGATNTNSGSIATTGDESDGISATANNAKTTNIGTIETGGASAHGVYLGGVSGGTTTNSGTISTTGAGAHGMFAEGGSRGMAVNSGSITTSGDMADGIFSRGSGAITISGSVSATGAGSHAIRGGDDANQTLTLLPGAQIRGRIDLGEKVAPLIDGTDAPAPMFVPDNDIANIITNAAAPSRTYTIEGADTFNLGELAVRNGDTVAVIDPTGSSAERVVLGTATSQLHQLVFQRLGNPPPPPPRRG